MIGSLDTGTIAFLVFLSFTLFEWVDAQNLTDAQISVIEGCLAQGASHSWEYGTRAEALLELNAPSYSALSSSSVPPPQTIPSNLSDALSAVFSIAQTIVANRSESNGNITGPQPLMADSSAGDPASIGVAVLLANWTGQSSADGLDYAGAAADQLNYLFDDVPKTSDGAISHRVDQLQLWSDFVYMAPPFIAYYGVVTQNQSLLEEAYTQISLYRNYLRDASANNLWKHIVLGTSGNDPGHWSTGNAWAAAGMIRVLGTIQRSQYANNLKNQQGDLANWVQEIHNGIYPHLNSNGLFFNYADDNTTFYDAASTAMLASTVYRLSFLWGVHTHLPFAEQCRKALSAPAGSTISITTSPSKTSSSSSFTSTSISSSPSSSSTSATTNLLHFSSDGWLTPVVDPYSYGQQGSNSPESEAFVLDMQAAWTDWVQRGAPGANDATRALSMSAGITWTCAGLVISWILLI